MDCPWKFAFMIKSEVSYMKYDNERDLLCCCQHSLAHNETLKFQLFQSKESDLESQSFEKKPPGEVSYTNYGNISNSLFFGLDTVVGLNKHLYELCKYFFKKKERVALVLGENGSGKTTLARKFSNYAVERKMFGQRIYIDFQSQINLREFQH